MDLAARMDKPLFGDLLALPAPAPDVASSSGLTVYLANE